jgi:phasin family protein
MAQKSTDPFAFEQMLGWLKPNAQLGGATEAMQSVGQMGKLVSESAEAAMRKQSQLVSDNISKMTSLMQELPQLRTPQDLFQAQATMFRTVMEAVASNMREMTEIWQRCGSGIADLSMQPLAASSQASPPRPTTPIRKAAE